MMIESSHACDLFRAAAMAARGASRKWLSGFVLALLLANLTEPLMAAPVGTAFVYQGSLAIGGQPAVGLYDFQFSLQDAASGGNCVAGPLLTNGIRVTIGLFTVSLDFGAGAFDDQARWLQIAVRTNGGGDFTTLASRQPITAAPYALRALNAVTLASLSGSIVATNPANQFSGTFTGNGKGLTNLMITGSELAPQSVSQTNLTLDYGLRIACADIDAFGLNRFAWPRTLAKLSSKSVLSLATVGNGWAEYSEFGGFVTNLLAYLPLAGYASYVTYSRPSLIIYGPSSGQDTALLVSGDDANWHGFYFVLTNANNVTATAQNLISDICGVHFLANSRGGSFVVEIRTNGASPNAFTDLDNTWIPVTNANAFNPDWLGRSVWWTNTTPVQTQVRVRATTSGWTPIVGQAQWNSKITNGVILSQYCHGASGRWWEYTDTNRVGPIWQAWKPDLVLLTGGADNSWFASFSQCLNLVRSGFAGADVVDIGAHITADPYDCSLERQFCLANGIPFFDGRAASSATWGSYSNGCTLRLYEDTAHLTVSGCAIFSQLVWSWLGLTSYDPANRLAMIGNGVTTNISIPGGATLYITNGQIKAVTVP